MLRLFFKALLSIWVFVSIINITTITHATSPITAWVKLCLPTKKFKTKEMCLIHHERLNGKNGKVTITTAIRNVKKHRDLFVVKLPVGYALTPGIQIRIDNNKPIQLPYRICKKGYCYATLRFNKALLSQLENGKDMLVITIGTDRKPYGYKVPLSGFSGAFYGKPIDTTMYLKARQNLIDKMSKRNSWYNDSEILSEVFPSD